jgi:hypothetical protein
MNRRSDYEVVLVEDDRVFIVDLDLGNRSVTNDAEKVLEEINNNFPGKRLIYRDTLGNWDEIKMTSPFSTETLLVGFFPYNEEMPDFTIAGYPSSELLRKN